MTDPLASLPHGPSFRFIDRLVELQPGISGTGEYNFTGSEPFLPGHFPGDPILPGVILIEMIAQLGGVIAQSDPFLPPLTNLRLAGVQNAKILAGIEPPTVLGISVRIDGRLGSLIQISGEIFHSGTAIAKGKITLSGD